MKWITVTDANGNDFHALTPDADAEKAEAWVFFDKTSGFGNNVGSIDLHRNLVRREDGKYWQS